MDCTGCSGMTHYIKPCFHRAPLIFWNPVSCSSDEITHSNTQKASNYGYNAVPSVAQMLTMWSKDVASSLPELFQHRLSSTWPSLCSPAMRSPQLKMHVCCRQPPVFPRTFQTLTTPSHPLEGYSICLLQVWTRYFFKKDITITWSRKM